MADEVVGNEDIKRDIRTKAEAYFESMLVERPKLRESWYSIRATNRLAFDAQREAWLHGFSEACARLIRYGRL